MNVRLKKEFQVLFWPWLVAALIGFLPLVIWWATSVFFGSPDDYHRLFHWRQNGYFIANTAFAMGEAILVSLPFGSELQERTLTLLLSQPYPRSHIWREKITVTLIAILLLALAHAAGYLINPAALWQNLKLAIVFLLIVFCSGIYWSLASRSVLGGIVLSLFSLAALFLLTYGLTDQYIFLKGITYYSSRNYSFLLPAAFFVASAFLWLAWRKFSRLEPSGMSEADPGASWAGTNKNLGFSLLRSRAANPIRNLALKELRLLRPVFLLMTLFTSLWILAALGTVCFPKKTELFSNIINGFSAVYLPVLIILAGCVSLGEEKRLGIHAANLSAPVSPTIQWLIKNSLACLTGLLGTVLIFSVMPYLTGGKMDVIASKFVSEATSLTIVTSLLILSLIQICLGTATIANRMIHAAFLAVVITTVSVMVFSGGWLFGHHFETLVQRPVYYVVAHTQMTCWSALGWLRLFSILIWCLSCLSLTYASWKCFRYLLSEGQNLVQSLKIMLGITITLAVLCGATYHSLDRNSFMQSPLCQDVKSAFVSLNMDVFTSEKNYEVDVAHHNVMATDMISPQTKAWLRDCTFKVIYEPEKAAKGSKPTIRVIVQFTKPGRYETIFLKPRSITP